MLWVNIVFEPFHVKTRWKVVKKMILLRRASVVSINSMHTNDCLWTLELLHLVRWTDSNKCRNFMKLHNHFWTNLSHVVPCLFIASVNPVLSNACREKLLFQFILIVVWIEEKLIMALHHAMWGTSHKSAKPWQKGRDVHWNILKPS